MDDKNPSGSVTPDPRAAALKSDNDTCDGNVKPRTSSARKNPRPESSPPPPPAPPAQPPMPAAKTTDNTPPKNNIATRAPICGIVYHQ